VRVNFFYVIKSVCSSVVDIGALCLTNGPVDSLLHPEGICFPGGSSIVMCRLCNRWISFVTQA